jgi:DNA-binding transcriptional LysR family regulator
VAVADSARRLLPRTVGLQSAQDVLSVPDMRGKFALQLAGLGCGFLPEPCARAAIASGALVALAVDEPKPDETFYLAWRTGEHGEALAWWQRRLRAPGVFDDWLQRLAATEYSAVRPGLAQ